MVDFVVLLRLVHLMYVSHLQTYVEFIIIFPGHSFGSSYHVTLFLIVKIRVPLQNINPIVLLRM